MRRPNTNAREEVAVRPGLIWLLSISIAVVIVPYLFTWSINGGDRQTQIARWAKGS
jgi:hypothetical protein